MSACDDSYLRRGDDSARRGSRCLLRESESTVLPFCPDQMVLLEVHDLASWEKAAGEGRGGERPSATKECFTGTWMQFPSITVAYSV